MAADYPTAWLYSVARRVLANKRKRSRRNENTAERAGALALPIRLDGPADDAIHVLELDKVFTAMTQFSDADQELLVLAALDQLSHAEIAVVLDIPVKTTKSRVYRARQRLQDRLVQKESPTRLRTAPEGGIPNV
ncbi:MAG: sigma-70 family RNA polymerase sigma factor [Acidobacteria bacterium]|nr:sigma-70 family RNA polymerase sigma factor [Acidobacteriota bacterium]